MGVKTTAIWECERCPVTTSLPQGELPEGWKGTTLSAPQFDFEDNFLDYTMVNKHMFTLLCVDCISDLEGFLHGEAVDAIDEPRNPRKPTEPKEKLEADLKALVVDEPTESAAAEELTPVVGGAQEKADG
jgi:hypothetical protein